MEEMLKLLIFKISTFHDSWPWKLTPGNPIKYGKCLTEVKWKFPPSRKQDPEEPIRWGEEVQVHS